MKRLEARVSEEVIDALRFIAQALGGVSLTAALVVVIVEKARALGWKPKKEGNRHE